MTDAPAAAPDDAAIALVFSGGLGLGAYQAGAYAALHASGARPDWLAGSSVGAVNAALIAGNPPEQRLAVLHRFWSPDARAAVARGPLREAFNWLSALQTRVVGSPGKFRPRILGAPAPAEPALYDLAPLHAALERHIDFARLNGGELRYTVAATDLETGLPVFFDTARGDRIGLDHLLASSGFIPEFAPRRIGERWLADGGLAVNAPIEVLRDDPCTGRPRISFVIDLFARDGELPRELAGALARKNDLLFANQTALRLDGLQREARLLEELDACAAAGARPRRYATRALVHLSYRPGRDEAGYEKLFDLSAASAHDRWEAGRLDMQHGLARCAALPRPFTGCPRVTVRRPVA